MTDQEREIDRVIKYIRSCRKAGIDTNIAIDKRKNHFILNALEEVLQYRLIGTVEECRETMEKQRAKKPDLWGDGVGDDGEIIYDMYDCPSCGESYEIDYDEYKHCPNCGQSMDLSDFVECDMEKIAPENCGIIKRKGKPETDSNGRCMGFGKSETDDEPCEQCKKCKHYTSYEED